MKRPSHGHLSALAVGAVYLCAVSVVLAHIGAARGAEVGAPAQTGKAPVSHVVKATPAAADLQHWRETIVHTQRPKKSCYVAHYPDTKWTEIACTKPPKTISGIAKGARPLTVGGGNDLSAQPASGLISQAEGSFDSVTGVTNETMILSTPTGIKESFNVFALQLNSNSGFVTTACNGKPGCTGWQQFIFSNSGCHDPKPACLYIESWLHGYDGMNCPPGNWYYTGDGNCKIDSSDATRLMSIPLSELGTVKLFGEVAGVDGPYDMAVLTVGTTMYSTPGDNNIPDFAQHWQFAEYNIVGNGDYSRAEFNPGSTFIVRISVDSDTNDAPTCVAEGTTGETNNLTITNMAFVHPINQLAVLKKLQITHQPTPVYPVPWSGWPSLVFTESNGPGVVPAGCPAAVTVGGTTVQGNVTVPKVSGQAAKYAYSALLASHLLPKEVTTPGCKDPGVVNEQAPLAGAQVPAGSTVTITYNQPKPGSCQAE
jgi:hypothetical protein